MGLGSYSDLGMGVAFTLEDGFSTTAAKIEASMARLDGYTEGLGAKIETSMTQMKLGFQIAAAGALILAPIGLSIKDAADFEQTEITFETLLGSVEKAKTMLNELKAFSASTPFQFQDVVEMTKRLLAMGIQAQDVKGDLKALGDIAAAVGSDKLPQLVLAFGQVNTKGKLAGGELRQFAEAGVPIIAQLAKNLGVAESAIGDMASKGEISFAQTRKALYDLTSGTGQFADLMDKQAGTTLGIWSNIQDMVYQTALSIGDIFLPTIKSLFTWIGAVVNKLKEFAENPIGKFIIGLVGVIGVLLVSLGTLLMLMGALRFAAYKTTEAFGMQTRAMLLQTFATQGLIAGLRGVAVAAWASLGPYLLIAAAIYGIYKAVQAMIYALKSSNPYIAAFGAALMLALGPIGWVVGAITILKRAIHEFDDTDDGIPKGGFAGYLQKIGGIIRGVMELWSSWDEQTQTFSLSDNVYKKLESLGLLQTVLNIGTWLARIKGLLTGLKDGFIDTFTYAKEGLKSLLNSFDPVRNQFERWGILVDKAKSSMEQWKDIGRAVGVTIAIALGSIIVLLGVIAALVVVVGGAVAAAIYIMYQAFMGIVDFFQFLYETIVNFWATLKEAFSNFGSWFMAIPDMLYETGDRMINALWNGIRNKWADMKAWIASAWETIKNMLGFTDNTGYIKNLIKIEETRADAQQGVFKPSTQQVNTLINSTAANKAAYATSKVSTAAPVVIHTKEEVVKNVTVNSNIDGKRVASHVLDITKTDSARH